MSMLVFKRKNQQPSKAVSAEAVSSHPPTMGLTESAPEEVVNSAVDVLERTIPSLLDEACDRHPNSYALSEWVNGEWRSLSTHDLRTAVENVALRLLALGLERGDRVAMLMHSDIAFCITDMACLLAGLVTVPIDLTQTLEHIGFILNQTQARVLVVGDAHLRQRVAEVVDEVLVVEANDLIRRGGDGGDKRDEEESERERLLELKRAIAPTDLATIIYVAGPARQPRGVMLTHENISATILSAFQVHPTLKRGEHEVALSFLPLTHIFARAFLYGHLTYGHSLYLTTPQRVVRHLRTVRPTIFITVPRLLEKVVERLVQKAEVGKVEEMGKIGKVVKVHPYLPHLPHLPHLPNFSTLLQSWALRLARRYELGVSPQGRYALQLRLANRLVFPQWRAVFGGRLKALICGGAALKAEIANILSAAGIPVLQGYGLTETSSVATYNRGAMNRAGTVGIPISGVEVAIAPDGEVLMRSPYVMQGYYRDPIGTREAIDADGWLHTGDLGHLSADGFLTLTGVKKNLFKLTTGKYVTASVLEQAVAQSPLVRWAIAIGANQKFCAMLIAPDLDTLNHHMHSMGYRLSRDDLLMHPCAIALYQSLIDEANCHLPYWSTVRAFRLVSPTVTAESRLLTPEGGVDRVKVQEMFAAVIREVYGEVEPEAAPFDSSPPTCPVPTPHCPASAQSLLRY